MWVWGSEDQWTRGNILEGRGLLVWDSVATVARSAKRYLIVLPPQLDRTLCGFTKSLNYFGEDPQ